MRTTLLFTAGVVVGMLMMQPIKAQQRTEQAKISPMRLNHVGISVKDFNRSVNFYTNTMGFREAFSFRDKDGKPFLTYLQINKDTFLELALASGDRVPGLSHIGIWVDDLNGTVAALRMRGVEVDDPRVGTSKARLINMTDPDGIRLELLEYVPESLQRKAMDTWER